jgi:hypothetical protein
MTKISTSCKHVDHDLVRRISYCAIMSEDPRHKEEYLTGNWTCVKSLKSEINTWLCSFRSKRRHWQSNYICVLGKWKFGSKTEEQGACVCALHHLASFPNYSPRSSWMLPPLVGKLSNFTSENFRLKTQVARNCAKTLGVLQHSQGEAYPQGKFNYAMI